MRVFLIGTGMGAADGLTVEAKRAMDESAVIIGAGRILDNFGRVEEKEYVVSYRPEEIRAYIDDYAADSGHGNDVVAILLSGDVGFYSGAKKLLEVLTAYEVRLICGISSVVFFCAKLKLAWEDVALASVHGRTCNLIGRIKRNQKTFALLGGGADLRTLYEKLGDYGMGDVKLTVGCRLSYPDEHIIQKTATEWKKTGAPEETLLVVLAENERYENRVAYSVSDEEFIRSVEIPSKPSAVKKRSDTVPMTKQEIRAVSIAKLRLSEDSVLYDIGAGTGSVGIEAALQSPDIFVCAVEQKEAACDLIWKNKRKFAADNVEIIAGRAPEALDGLPVPSHAFLGGTGGAMEEIINCLFQKNENIRIVINIIALESMARFMELWKQHPEWQVDIVGVQTATAQKAGEYHLMTGGNPVYVITIQTGRV